jgi:predicted HicB family RNase H-like nuclease
MAKEIKRMIPAPETKEATLVLRIRPSVKAMAKEMAKAEDRSLANYIEILIKADFARAKK